MLKKLMKRFASDSGNSLVTLVIVLPLVVTFLITPIDFAIYSNNRSQLQSVARDAARTVAIMGGNGTQYTQTPLERQYADTTTPGARCGWEDFPADSRAFEAYGKGLTTIECRTALLLNGHSGLVNTKITDVNCNPVFTSFIGQDVTCEIEWEYGGIPGSVFSALSFNRDQSVTGTSNSEVKLESGDLVSRSGG